MERPVASGRAPPVAVAMLGPGLGGLEQSLLDYTEALALEGHRVVAICHPEWPERAVLAERAATVETCRSLGAWDPLAALRLRRVLARLAPAATITIGRRASGLVRRAQRGRTLPQIGVAQNYSFKALIGLDHVFATTRDLKRALIAAGQPGERITVIPNMVRVPADVTPRPDTAGPPVIGALGRFVAKKGFLDLIDAAALLRDRGRDFELRLAGDGPEAAALRRRIDDRGLAERVRLPGWVRDKAAFFRELDLFCIPSLHEPFGIVVIEGFAHAQAMVVTDAEGPLEIIEDGRDALLVPKGDPAALAERLDRLLGDPELRQRLAAAALAEARATYDLPVVARRLSAALREVVADRTGGPVPPLDAERPAV
ncbi:MAG TPA: glycosyltransferase family 4 protein [Geminicoccaceae bacterium]